MPSTDKKQGSGLKSNESRDLNLPADHGHNRLSQALHWSLFHRLNETEKKVVDLVGREGLIAIDRVAKTLDMAEDEAAKLVAGLIDRGFLHRHHSDVPNEVCLASRHQESFSANDGDDDDAKFTKLRRHLISKIFLYCRFRALAVIAGYFIQVLLARHLLHSEYGFYSIVTSTATLIGYMVSLGFPTSLERFIPTYISDDGWDKVKGLVGVSRNLTIIVGLATVAIAAPIIYLSPQLSQMHKLIFAFGMILVPLYGLVNVTTSALEAEKKFNISFFVDLFLPSALMLAFFGSMTFIWQDMTAGHAVSASVMVQAVILAILIKKQHDTRSPDYIKAEPKRKTKKWVLASLPILLMTGFVIIVYRADLFIVGYLLGAHSAGIYAAALAVSDMLAIFLKAADSVANPEIAPMSAKKDTFGLQRLMGMVAGLSFWPTLVFGAGIAIFGDTILDAFGPKYDEGYYVLLLLIGCRVVKAWSGAPGFLLIMTSNQIKLVKTYVASVVFDIGLLFLLTWKLGMVGAALGSLLAMLFSRIWLVVVAHRTVGVHTSLFARFLLKLKAEEQ